MRRLRAFLRPLPILLIAAAIACGLAAGADHRTVKHALDARSGDGDVESYTTAFHAAVQDHLRVAMVAFAVCALLAVLLHAFIERSLVQLRADARCFRSDLRAWWAFVRGSIERTDALLLPAILLAGIALRAVLLREAVIYDEAFTCTYYAVRPWYIVVSDYSYPNNHVLHTLLVKASMALFGWGEAQARLPAFAAGIVALVLFWTWMRTAYGAGAARWALVLAAFCGPLVEYSALARGYSMTWSFLLLGVLLARHFIRTGNRFTGLLLSAINALGMWAVPTMLYGSLMLFLYAFHGIWKRGGDDGPAHLRRCIASGLSFLVLVLLLYMPVLVVYGPGQLFYDDTMGPRSWAHFVHALGHKLDELGAHFTLESPWAWSVLLVFGPVLGAAFSPDFRRVFAALFLASVPLVLLQHMLAPPRAWDFILWILLAGGGIAFDRSARKLGVPGGMERVALIAASVLLALPFLHDRPGRANRFDEARATVDTLASGLGPADRVAVYVMWQSPIEFYLIDRGLGSAPLYRPIAPGATLWLVVGTEDGTHMDEVLRFARIDPAGIEAPREVKVLPRSMIFAARING